MNGVPTYDQLAAALRRLPEDVGASPTAVLMVSAYFCYSTQRAVKKLTAQLETTEGIERKGLVPTFLMRFKQIRTIRRTGLAMAHRRRKIAVNLGDWAKFSFYCT